MVWWGAAPGPAADESAVRRRLQEKIRQLKNAKQQDENGAPESIDMGGETSHHQGGSWRSGSPQRGLDEGEDHEGAAQKVDYMQQGVSAATGLEVLTAPGSRGEQFVEVKIMSKKKKENKRRKWGGSI